MRILVFGNAEGFGGAQTAFRRFVDFCVADEHRVGVIALAGKDDELPAAGSIEFGLKLRKGCYTRFGKLWDILNAALVAHSFMPEVFVAVGLARSSGLIARLLPRTTFRVAQDFIFGRNTNDYLLRITDRSFDALAVQAPSMVLALKSNGYKELPVNWLPCFPELPKSGYQKNTNQFSEVIRLAYFGRLAPNKGLDLLLKAMARVNLKVPMILDIWGGGPELENLRSLSEVLKLAQFVNFLGPYPDGEAGSKLICNYDGLVLPSTGSEGLPLILLEAMAYGIPFLTTKVGAIPDCCEGNLDCELVGPSIPELLLGLERFVERTNAGLFAAARLQEYYQRNFSFDNMANRWRKMLLDPHTFFNSYA